MQKLVLLIMIFLSFSVSADSLDLRITDIRLADEGGLEPSEPYQTVDTVQGECQNESDTTPEPFSDSMIKLDIKNNTDLLFRAKAIRYIVKLGNGRKVTSKWLSPAGTFDIESKASGNLYAFFLKEDEGLKYYVTRRLKAVTENGFRSVRFTVKGNYSNGKSTKITKKTSLSFKDIDRCR